MIDIHCHILPGLDDGPKTLNESLEMCRRALANGITTIVATPHRGNPAGNTTGSVVLSSVKKLKAVLKEHKIPIEILPGHEVRISENILDDIDKGRALTVNNKKKYILLELPFESVPFYVYEVVKKIKEKEITPIIAHPERNDQIQEDKRVMKRLIAAGALSQITGGSLLGQFGTKARKSAVSLLKSGLAHVMASDSHAFQNPPSVEEVRTEVVRVAGEKIAKVLFETNPKKIVKGEAV